MAYLNISDVSQKIAEVKKTYNENLDKYGIEDPTVIVNNSGGKDSGATDLLAFEILEGNYRSVAADTGNEHPWTIEHLKGLHHQRNGNPVEIVSMEYGQELFDARKEKVIAGWAKKQKVQAGAYRGILMPSLTRTDTKFAEVWRANANRIGWEGYEAPIDAFNDAFVKSGNPFLDMCLLHGGFPLGRSRYCTDELKIQVVFDKIITPLLDEGKEIIQWSGVRGDESEKRARYNRFEVDRRDEGEFLFNFLPVHQWTAQDVFAIYKHFGVKPNPLYKKGMGRVGCMPCVLVEKEELAEIAARFPEQIDRIDDWEKKVAKVSRWVHWMITGHINRRQFKAKGKAIVGHYKNKKNKDVILTKLMSNPKDKKFLIGNDIMQMVTFKEVKQQVKFGVERHHAKGYKLHIERYNGTSMLGPRGNVIGGNVRDAVEWAKTGKGGMVYDLVSESLTQDVCSSKYGLCGN